MALNKKIRFGPTAITNAASNMINPPTVSGGTGLAGTNSATYVTITKMSVVNKTGSAAALQMFIGATGGSAAGTEFAAGTTSIPANQTWSWGGALRLDTADFLTAIANANTTLVFQAEGEIGVAG